MAGQCLINKSYFFIVLLLGVLPSNVFSLNQQSTQLIHFPVTTSFEGHAITLEAKFEDLSKQVQYIRVFYRIKGSEDYQYIEMDEGTENFVATIPASQVKAPTMEYFLFALLTDQSTVSSPASNPFFAPYEVTVTKGAGAAADTQQTTTPPQKIFSSTGETAANVVILSPEPNSNIGKDEAIVAVSFMLKQGNIDVNSVQLFLDRRNVTARAEVSKYMVSYVPANISVGKHHVLLKLKDTGGNNLNPVKWNFVVVGEEKVIVEKRLPITGKLYFNVKNENINDSTVTTISGGTNFYGRYGKIQYKGSAFITSRELKDQQPRNRFFFDVGTSSLGIRLGDTNPRFNDLILWGKRVRGINAYLKLGFFNLEFVQGETYRSIAGKQYDIQIDSTSGATLWIHPTTGDTVQSTTGIYKYGTYKQTLLGIRPSFGSGKKFQFGLNFLKVKDDLTSSKYAINPKDNIVVGPDILITFDKQRVEFKAGAAFSLLTNDISTGPISKEDLESMTSDDTTKVADIPIDPASLENFFIYNTSTIPLLPHNMTSLAYNMQFKFNYFKNSLRILYKSIGSEYYSLGNTFLRKNIKGFAISDRIRLLKNQLYLTLGYEQYLDGLNKIKDGNPDTEPTALKTFNIGISYYPRAIGLPKVSLNFKDHNRDNGLDTLNAVGSQTQDISVQLSYDLKLLNFDNSISLSIIGSDRGDDFNPATSNVGADVTMLTLKTKYQIPLTTIVALASNQSNTGEDSTKYSFKYNQFGLNAIYMLLNNRLKINGGLNVTSGIGTKPVDDIPEEYTNYKRVAFNIGGNFQITPKQYILLDTILITVDDKYSSSYNDTIFRLRYEMKL